MSTLGASKHLDPPFWITVWFVISTCVVFWDAGYCLLRPRSMIGGDLHWLWPGYGLYSTIDYIYGLPSFTARNGFTSAQATLNLIENVCNIEYVIMANGLFDRPRRGGGRGGGRGRGRETAMVVGFAGATMTLSKTLLYWLQEYFCGYCCVGQNSVRDLIFLWMIPNGIWIIVPFFVVVSLGGKITHALRCHARDVYAEEERMRMIMAEKQDGQEGGDEIQDEEVEEEEEVEEKKSGRSTVGNSKSKARAAKESTPEPSSSTLGRITRSVLSPGKKSPDYREIPPAADEDEEEQSNQQEEEEQEEVISAPVVRRRGGRKASTTPAPSTNPTPNARKSKAKGYVYVEENEDSREDDEDDDDDDEGRSVIRVASGSSSAPPSGTGTASTTTAGENNTRSGGRKAKTAAKQALSKSLKEVKMEDEGAGGGGSDWTGEGSGRSTPDDGVEEGGRPRRATRGRK